MNIIVFICSDSDIVDTMKPTVLDLFSGCGGMSWGLHKAGFQIRAGIDSWQPALDTFQLNHPDSLAIRADLSTYTPDHFEKDTGIHKGDIDCIIGGPPCQGFSKNVPAAYRFLDDPRNQLFREFLDYVAHFLPRVVVMENVAEIYNAYDGDVRREITSILEHLGYLTNVKVVLAADYGVPQMRRRCIFLASRTRIEPQFPDSKYAANAKQDLFNPKCRYWSAWDAISDLPQVENGGGYQPMQYTDSTRNEFQSRMRANVTELYDHVTRKLNETQFARVQSIEAGQGIKDLPDSLRPMSGYSGAYGRLNFEDPAPTITRWVFHPGSGRYCHPISPRLITIREAARLQSFSDDFRFTGTYIQKAHQLGNAVPPILMEELAPSIIECLSSSIVDQ